LDFIGTLVAVAEFSALRKPVKGALLKIYEDALANDRVPVVSKKR